MEKKSKGEKWVKEEEEEKEQALNSEKFEHYPKHRSTLCCNSDMRPEEALRKIQDAFAEKSLIEIAIMHSKDAHASVG